MSKLTVLTTNENILIGVFSSSSSARISLQKFLEMQFSEPNVTNLNIKIYKCDIDVGLSQILDAKDILKFLPFEIQFLKESFQSILAATLI